MIPEGDASAGEANLARAMLRQAKNMALAGNIEGSLRISREVVDRYWSKQGKNAGAVATDAFEAYLSAARSLVKTADQFDAFVWQSDLLIERLLEKQDSQRAISLLEDRAWHAVMIMNDGVNGYRDATRLIDLITRHHARQEDQLDSHEINDKIHEALQLRFEAPSSNRRFLGAAEDMVGFEISHPALLTDSYFAETCEALYHCGLVGPALSLQLIAENHFGEDKKQRFAPIMMEWLPEDYFAKIHEYWTLGEGHLFGWRLPRMSTAGYMEYLTKTIAESGDEERAFAEKMLVSAARNSERIEEIWLAVV